jgi:N-hydroxyarylamine O-acetyltransferase
MPVNSSKANFTRYLDLLGVTSRTPTKTTLQEVVRAHLMRIPFENVSKLYRKKNFGLRGLPSLEMYLDGIEQFRFGGTCYANNYHLYRLLQHMGFEVKLCGAGMSKPDVHIVSMVRCEGREYLADVGYAAPFLEPLPLDRQDDVTVILGNDRYVLKPRDHDGCSRMELYREGVLLHRYVVSPVPRGIRHFRKVIADSFAPTATFMNALLLVRFAPGRSWVIHNTEFIESIGQDTRKRSVPDGGELVRLIEQQFSIPRQIVTDALSDLGELRNAWM